MHHLKLETIRRLFQQVAKQRYQKIVLIGKNIKVKTACHLSMFKSKTRVASQHNIYSSRLPVQTKLVQKEENA